MPGAGRDYISTDVSGADVEDFDLMQAIGDAIVQAFGDHVHYRATRLDTTERIEEELRNPALILAASGGRLPVMLVNITYRTEEFATADFAPLEARFALKLVTETIQME